MRKKIALFANGWSSEFLQEIGQGIRLVAARADVDIFAFINYTVHVESDEKQLGEFNIYKLPDLKSFDGVLMMTSTFNMQREIDYIYGEIKKIGIPAVSLEYKLDGISYIGSDDYCGMYDLAEHMIVDHDAENILFIGGIKEHDGSNTRLKAVMDAASKHGINIPDDNIIYGHFAAAPAVRGLEEWLGANGILPDAIICANDVMAIGVCEWLKEKGYKIPKDVKVTGFDCLEAGMNFEPSITSVSGEWLTMGSKCMEKLLQIIDGKSVEDQEIINTSLVCGESCGCNYDSMYYSSKMRRRGGAKKKIDGFYCDQHFRHMYLAMRKSQTAPELNERLSRFFVNEGWLEGENVMLAFHPNFFISNGWDSIKMEGFPDRMDVVCSVQDKKSEPIRRMLTKDVVFSMAEHNKKAGIYIFVPIRVDEVSLGFAVLSKGFSILQNDILYLWCRHMSQYTEQVKSNVMIEQLTKRLETLSVTDGLTGVYNRTGCDTIIYPALVNNQQLNGRSVVMLADVDKLKMINDNFGHGSGDHAICLVVKALQRALPPSYMIGRYGGDEFLIGGCEKETVDIEGMLKKIEESLLDVTSKHNVGFKLTVSVGAIQLEQGEELDINECIKKTDDKMYQIKTKHHEKG